jgi:exodeoxyribonuclease VII large subunit
MTLEDWLRPEEETAASPQALSISELNRQIRDLVEGQYPVLWVRGEISNFKAHTSGHHYFSLKDSKSQVSAVMFRGFNQHLRFRPEDGMEVLVRGKVTVYEPQGKYQIFCETMEPVGAGALQAAFEQLKKKLEKEGLFQVERKRPLPALPQHVALVTSPTGAAIRDMLNVLRRRFRGLRITLVPCRVQGDRAAGEIVKALELAQRLPDVDVIIAGRGGGSIEDLWCFNEESVARAIATCRVPVISAVGHEIDFTIADFVADRRAPTPSAAAELVVQNAAELLQRVQLAQRGLVAHIQRQLQQSASALRATERRLIDPKRRLQDLALRLDEFISRLETAMRRELTAQRQRVELLQTGLKGPILTLMARSRGRAQTAAGQLESLSPLRVLARGYGVVRREGEIVRQSDQVQVGDRLSIELSRGQINARVEERR